MVISSIVKSGGSEFHGGILATPRDYALNANDLESQQGRVSRNR